MRRPRYACCSYEEPRSKPSPRISRNRVAAGNRLLKYLVYADSRVGDSSAVRAAFGAFWTLSRMLRLVVNKTASS
jgi:hypothetical protein